MVRRKQAQVETMAEPIGARLQRELAEAIIELEAVLSDGSTDAYGIIPRELRSLAKRLQLIPHKAVLELDQLRPVKVVIDKRDKRSLWFRFGRKKSELCCSRCKGCLFGSTPLAVDNKDDSREVIINRLRAGWGECNGGFLVACEDCRKELESKYPGASELEICEREK